MLETCCERFAIRSGFLIAQHQNMSAERVLHIPLWVANARLPIEPCLPEQLTQEPGVDVAAMIMPNVDDKTLPVEYRGVLSRPLGDVVRSHRLQVDVSNLPVGV